VVRDALPGPVERGAVIDGHAQEWQPDGDVDTRQAGPLLDRLVVLEAERLHRDVALVVIHRDDDVELAAAGAREERVGGQGTGDVEAVGAGRLDGGNDRALLLVAEQALLAGVRVEPGPGDAAAPPAGVPAPPPGPADRAQ